MNHWAKMPSYWLRNRDNPPLTGLKWIGYRKSDHIAALMLYIVLVQHANTEPTPEFPEVGCSRLTYERLSEITGLSRAKISGGLGVLKELDAIAVELVGRSNRFQIKRFGEASGWAKLPAKGIYTKNLREIRAFHQFKLRSKTELNALKLYLIILATRDNSKNYAIISYDKICSYSGMNRADIRPAISLLVTLNLIHVDRAPSDLNQFSSVNMYRPCYLDSYNHPGTTGRQTEGSTEVRDFEEFL